MITMTTTIASSASQRSSRFAIENAALVADHEK
jgi:hypothetical protein